MGDKRERILLCAQKHFMEHGFSNVSMDEIAHECGVGKATIYKYFPSKEELLISGVNNCVDKMGNDMGAILSNPSLPPANKLIDMLKPLLELLSHLRPAAIEDIRRNAPVAYNLIDSKRKELIFGNISNLIRNGQKSGIFKTDVSPELVAHIVQGAVSHIAEPSVMMSLGIAPPILLRSVILTVMEGCLTLKGREEIEK